MSMKGNANNIKDKRGTYTDLRLGRGAFGNMMIDATVANYCHFLVIVMLDVVCELGWRGDTLQKLIQLNTTIVGGGESEVNPGMHHIAYVVRIQVRNGSSLRSTRCRFDTFENVCPCGGGCIGGV